MDGKGREVDDLVSERLLGISLRIPFVRRGCMEVFRSGRSIDPLTKRPDSMRLRWFRRILIPTSAPTAPCDLVGI